MPMSRPKIKHKPRTKAPAGEVIVRKIALGWPDLAKSLQDDALRRLGPDAQHRVKVLAPGQYEAPLA